jgi:hypothetical protein
MRAISYIIGYKVEPNINSVEVHPQFSCNGHPVDGALVWHTLENSKGASPRVLAFRV